VRSGKSEERSEKWEVRSGKWKVGSGKWKVEREMENADFSFVSVKSAF